MLIILPLFKNSSKEPANNNWKSLSDDKVKLCMDSTPENKNNKKTLQGCFKTVS